MIDGCVKRLSNIYPKHPHCNCLVHFPGTQGRFALGEIHTGIPKTQRHNGTKIMLNHWIRGYPFRRSAILFRCSGDCCNKDMGMITASWKKNGHCG